MAEMHQVSRREYILGMEIQLVHPSRNLSAKILPPFDNVLFVNNLGSQGGIKQTGYYTAVGGLGGAGGDASTLYCYSAAQNYARDVSPFPDTVLPRSSPYSMSHSSNRACFMLAEAVGCFAQVKIKDDTDFRLGGGGGGSDPNHYGHGGNSGSVGGVGQDGTGSIPATAGGGGSQTALGSDGL